jgi:hypothetical protein
MTKKRSASKKSVAMKHFRISKEPGPFMSMCVTKQTVYWLILSAYIILLSMWVLKIYIDTQTILNGITN